MRITSAAVLGMVLVVLMTFVGRASAFDGEGDDDPKWIGVWSVNYSANYSTCENHMVGEARVGTLTIRALPNGDLRAVEEIDDTRLEFQSAGGTDAGLFMVCNVPGGQAGLQISWKAGKGRRVIANSRNQKPCAIIYDVKARKLK